MTIAKERIATALSPPLPEVIVKHLLDDYTEIKQHFACRKFQPSELNGGRFAEDVLRLVEHLDRGTYTPFGTPINSEGIVNRALNNTTLHDSMRFYIPRLARILLDVRNRRNVAHPGGDVDPNLSDSLFVAHSADWVLTEILRLYYCCSINDAKKIAESLNEFSIPIIADVDGFVRVQNTKLDFKDKALVILYYKHPNKVSDATVIKWAKYANASRGRDLLNALDSDAFIHYENGMCTLLNKGVLYVERHIEMDMLI
jgi:hypothetical protein